jgi:hypothetical protein
MKNHLFAAMFSCISFLLVSPLLQAQTPQVGFKTIYLPEVKMENTYGETLQLGSSIYSLSITEKKQLMGLALNIDKMVFGISLKKVNVQTGELKESAVSNGRRLYGPFDPMIKVIKNNVFLLYYQFVDDGTGSNYRFMAAQIDTNTLELQTPKEILPLKNKNLNINQFAKLWQNYSLQISTSPDLKKTAFVWSSGINQDMIITVTDENLNSLWTKTETFKLAKNFKVISLAVDNKEVVYTGVQSLLKSDDYEGFVTVCKPNDAFQVRKIELVDKQPFEVHVQPSASGSIFVTGTYYEEVDELLKGAFYMELGPAGFENQRLTAFPEKLLTQLGKMDWAATKKRRYGLMRLKMNSVGIETGAVSLVGHFQKTEMVNNHFFGLSGNLLTIVFDKNRTEFSTLPKIRVNAQSVIGDNIYGTSFQDKTVVFYNDVASNLNKGLDESPVRSDNYRDAVLVASVTHPDGKVERIKVADLAAENFLAIPNLIQKLSANTYLVPFVEIKSMGGRGDKMRWATVEIK